MLTSDVYGSCRRSFLYVFIGLASFVVWSQGGFQEQTGPLALYAVNLVLNLAWMPVSPFAFTLLK